MAGEIVDQGGKTIATAAAEAQKLEGIFTKIEKRAKAVQAINLSEQIAKGIITLKEAEEIYARLEGDVDAIAEELGEIVEKTDKAKTATIEWHNQLNDVSKTVLGITIPALTVNGLLSAAASTAANWYNHTFELERKVYDVSAALGDAGTRGLEFEEIISKTALSFHASSEEIRGVVDGLADAGATGADITEILDDVVARTRLWSDLTPEKQIALMGDYMKEFGMNGREASAAMNTLWQTSSSLREELAKSGKAFDMKVFMEQTQQAAVNMRGLGLEAEDAIALTATLTRLGVEQARVPELAKRLGGIGMEDSATSVFMAQEFLLPELQRQQTAAITGAAEGGPASKEEMVERGRRIELMESGVVGAKGVMAMATGKERTMAQMGMLEKMLGAVQVKLTDPIDKLVGGLTLVDLPGIGKMGIQEAEEFGKAVQGLQEKGMGLKEAISETMRSTADAMDPLKVQQQQLETAKEVADATVSSKDKLAAIADNTKAILTFMQGTTDYESLTPEEARTAEKAKLLRAAGGYETKKKFKTKEAYEFEQAVGLRKGFSKTEFGPTVASAAGGEAPAPQEFRFTFDLDGANKLTAMVGQNNEMLRPGN